jgi:ribosomal protein L37AE/L43A
MRPQHLRNLGEKLSLEEIEALRRSLKNCPKCGSGEGFWFTPKRDRGYIQCKHCGATLEICEFFSQAEESKVSKELLRKSRV